MLLIVFVPPAPERVIEDGGACAPTAPLMKTDPVAPGVMVRALAALSPESIAALKVITEAAAVDVNVVAAFSTTGAP